MSFSCHSERSEESGQMLRVIPFHCILLSMTYFTLDCNLVLDIQILEPDKDVLKRIETNRDREYKFEAEETGNYWIVITGDNAGGSYEIQWDITS